MLGRKTIIERISVRKNRISIRFYEKSNFELGRYPTMLRPSRNYKANPQEFLKCSLKNFRVSEKIEKKIEEIKKDQPLGILITLHCKG